MALSLIRTPVPELQKSEVFYPFGQVAVTLSGGGFRASAFSLGCLSYLHTLKYGDKSLLQRVKFVAGASGGAMTGILFSAHNHGGIPFEKTYAHLRNNVLDGDKILKEAARIINDDKEWVKHPTKNRNPINAFALAYQKLAFDNMKFDVYWDRSKSNIEEVCFNASELENGRAFRFQTDGRVEVGEILGNNYLRLRDNSTAAVRGLNMGDIMAASSCFPAGFEPMIFPDDFAKDEQHKQQLLSETDSARFYDWEEYVPFNRSFALMDGGITDNQGIESIKLANDRHKKRTGRGYDLVLICDAANYFMEPFEPIHETRNWWNNISLGSIINLHKYSFIPVLIAAIMIFTQTLTGLAWVIGTVSTIMYLLYLFGRYQIIGETFSNAGSNKPEPGESFSRWNLPIADFWGFFFSGPVARSQQLIKTRMRSALRVALEIYLLQIRRINYDSLYTNAEWSYKTKAVSIYELSKSSANVLQRQFKRKKFNEEVIQLLTPSEAIMDAAENARQMGTTLWFTKRDKAGNKRDSIIATGQFTMCYNLIEYILQVEDKYPEMKADADVVALKKKLLSDWKLFQTSPMMMVDGAMLGEERA